LSAVAETAVVMLGLDGLASTGALVYVVRRVSPWPKLPAPPQVRVNLQPETVTPEKPADKGGKPPTSLAGAR
jgi:hypothetical protein